MNENTSDALVRSLLRPEAYPHPVKSIDLLQTHISWLILTGDFAYKIKKPVDLGFVNFTTLDRRHFFCDEELRLNRRLAPQMYLDVQSIVGTPESPHVGGSGTPIEFAVRMRQFSQEQLLSRLIRTGRLLPGHIDALAAEVAEFHRRIPVADATSRFGTPEAVAKPIRENFAHLQRPEANGDRLLLTRLRDWCEIELKSRHAALLERKQKGMIRECHGDMHLGNMILIERGRLWDIPSGAATVPVAAFPQTSPTSAHGRLDDDAITIFDCIEFNEDLRWIDVMSEAAFCTMDLTDRGRTDLSRRFLNACLESSGDYNGLVVLPLYVTYRALVRAKVAALRRSQPDVAAEDRKRLAEDLENYLQLAERSTRAPKRFLAITHGLSGSGKTWGSQAIVEGLGTIRVRSDLERKRLAGVQPLARTGSPVAGELYAPDVTEKTYEALQRTAAVVLDAGFPTVADATFLSRRERDRLRAIAEKRGTPFVILDFPTDEGVCRQRIRDRFGAAADASEATEEVLDHQLRTADPLGDDERAFVIAMHTARPESVDRAVAEIEQRSAQT
jgi:uncharacterized protein